MKHKHPHHAHHAPRRAYNFNAGPSALPLEALIAAQRELLDYKGTGMSVLEISHRSAEYAALHAETKNLLRRLMNIPDTHEIMFIQGGGSTQFLMTAANFHTAERAAYINTGVWSGKAMAEAKHYGETYEAAGSADRNHSYIPTDYTIKPGTSYLHITANNTIYGTEYSDFPAPGVPLICDMSSDILSRRVDVSRFSLIYAGAQKNLGPAGVTIVIADKAYIETARDGLPTMLSYKTFLKHDSLYNTPPVYAIYLINKTLKWLAHRGIDRVAADNAAKAALIYDTIDASGGYYIGHAEKASRSRMNITFTLADAELQKKFLAEAKNAGFIGLNGHRLVGGCRASCYNAVPYEHCRALADFMNRFRAQNP